MKLWQARATRHSSFYKEWAETADEESFAAFKEWIGYFGEGEKTFEELLSIFNSLYLGMFESKIAFAEMYPPHGLVKAMGEYIIYFDWESYAETIFINDYVFLGNGFVFKRG